MGIKFCSLLWFFMKLAFKFFVKEKVYSNRGCVHEKAGGHSLIETQKTFIFYYFLDNISAISVFRSRHMLKTLFLLNSGSNCEKRICYENCGYFWNKSCNYEIYAPLIFGIGLSKGGKLYIYNCILVKFSYKYILIYSRFYWRINFVAS